MHLGAHELADAAIKSAVTASRKLKQSSLNSNVERDLTAAVAEVFEVAGWITFDAERQEDSARLNRQALSLASLAGDSKMETLTKLNMSMQSTHDGKYGEAVSIAQSIIDSNVSARVHTMCLVRQARAFSKANNDQAVKIFQQAQSRFQDGLSTQDPAWAWWIDGYELDGQYACALLDLGKSEAAAPILWNIVESIDNSKEPMYRTIWLIRLLESLIFTEQWCEVEKLLASIESKIDEIGSTRALRSLAARARELSRSTAKIPSTVQDIAHLVNTGLRDR